MRRVALTNSHEFAIVDEQDAERVCALNWYAFKPSQCWYVFATVGRESMHHFVLGAKPPPGRVVDHIDRNGLNNTRANLRICTTAQNAWNCDRKLGASGHPGVSKNRNHWTVRFEHQGQTMYFGTFRALDEAKSVATREMARLRGEYMPLRARLQELERAA